MNKLQVGKTYKYVVKSFNHSYEEYILVAISNIIQVFPFIQKVSFQRLTYSSYGGIFGNLPNEFSKFIFFGKPPKNIQEYI